MSARPLVLLSDFGSTDFYAGVMRSVIVSSSPSSPVIDLDHDIPAHDIDAASFVLARAFEYLPRDAVVVCVVDPGVGTGRRALVITLGERTLVGPDNGFASDLLLANDEGSPSFSVIDAPVDARRLVAAPAGATFHGRDIFAPVAAAIARGAAPAEFGAPVDGIVMLRDVPGVSIDGDVMRGRGRYVDRFGNVLTDIPARTVRERWGDVSRVDVSVAGHRCGALRETYAPGRPGELMALVNSWGMVEAAVNGGRAIDRLGNRPASAIRFELRRL